MKPSPNEYEKLVDKKIFLMIFKKEYIWMIDEVRNYK
jgi:hypothetical protein